MIRIHFTPLRRIVDAYIFAAVAVSVDASVALALAVDVVGGGAGADVVGGAHARARAVNLHFYGTLFVAFDAVFVIDFNSTGTGNVVVVVDFLLDVTVSVSLVVTVSVTVDPSANFDFAVSFPLISLLFFMFLLIFLFLLSWCCSFCLCKDLWSKGRHAPHRSRRCLHKFG